MFRNLVTNNSIRKYVIGFGTLFNDMHVLRRDGMGNPVKDIHVPIAYANKRNWYYKRTQDNLENAPIAAISYPRMYYDMTGFAKDSTKQLPPTAMLNLRNINERRMYMCRNRVPYKFNFELGIASTYNSDVMDMIEQIAYLFSPTFTMEINEIPQLNIISDIPITLESVTRAHSVENDLSKLDVKAYTLQFTLDGYMYPPIGEQGVITKTLIDIDDAIGKQHLEQVVSTALGPDKADGVDSWIHRKDFTREDPNIDRPKPFYGDIHHPEQDLKNI